MDRGLRSLLVQAASGLGRDDEATVAPAAEAERHAQVHAGLEASLREERRRSAELAAAFDRLRRAVEPCLHRLSGSSETLNGAADELSRAAVRITSETTTVSVAAEEANRKVETVSAAGQDFLETIARIGDLAARSARKGADAVEQAEATTGAFDELTATSRQIGEVTSLIAGIASQTNLLALNATIEAARAGEQGRGFAIVAGEVKSLARDTANAVEIIADMVARIQASTARSVDAVDAIAASIRDLNESTGHIAAAVDERIKAAADMADGVARAAANVHFVMTAIGTIETIADETLQGAGFLRETAGEVADQSSAIRSAIDSRAAAVTPAGTPSHESE